MLGAKHLSVLCVVLWSVLEVCLGTHKCIEWKGRVECRQNPDRALMTELKVYDRDGEGKGFGWLDRDDLMGRANPDEDGNFVVRGCGDDYNWLPWVPNNPEPYLRIFEVCTSEDGRDHAFRSNIIYKYFPPHVHDFGTIVLDEL